MYQNWSVSTHPLPNPQPVYFATSISIILFFLIDSLLSFQSLFNSPKLLPGSVELSTQQFGTPLNQSSMTSEGYKAAVLQAKEHILAGDIFQIVLSQRFERRTFADPFEIYRALRVVNPSPYMTYLQVNYSYLFSFVNYFSHMHFFT